MKTICAVGLVVFALTVGTARGDEPKSYRITLTEAKIGDVSLKAGEYKLLVHFDHPKVQLLHIKTGDLVDVPAKVDTTGSKVNTTEIHSQTVDGAIQITEIRIGGKAVRIDFRKGS